MSEPADNDFRVGDDDRGLLDSLRDLASLVTGAWGLTELLEKVATFATGAIPGADGAGVTLLHDSDGDNPIEALAASHPFVAEIDTLQYEVLQEGPCMTAVRERRTVRTGSLGGEPMWPRFGPRVGRLGVHSALSLPLMLGERVVGAINVYARNKDAFDERSAELGEMFAAPAAVAVHNAQILHQANVLVEQLKEAIAARPIVDQAIGLVRARTGATSDEALARLRALSQQQNVKVVEIARRIVDDAVRRAIGAHTGRG